MDLTELYNSGIGDEKDKYRLGNIILQGASNLLEGQPSNLDKINTTTPDANQVPSVIGSGLDQLSNTPVTQSQVPNLEISGLNKTTSQLPTTPRPGLGAGIIEGVLGKPESVGDSTPGTNAYWVGRLIPDIVRSKLGVPTATEQKYYQNRMTKEEKEALAYAKVAREEEKTSAAQKKVKFNQTMSLKNSFSRLPEVKDYIYTSTTVKGMEALLQKSKIPGQAGYENKVSLDQGLITMFNKLTDPNSVVRESEYARTPGNLPMVNRFTGALYKVQQGGAGLTDKDREALVWGAKVILKERGAAYEASRADYENQALAFDLDPSLVVGRQTPSPSEFETLPGKTTKKVTVSSWTPEKEARRQELLKKKEGK